MPEQQHRDRLTALHRLLSERLSEEELRTLCFDLQVDYEDLPGKGKAGKARELLLYLTRRRRIAELRTYGRRMRPDLPWRAAPRRSSRAAPTAPAAAPAVPARAETPASSEALQVLFPHTVACTLAPPGGTARIARMEVSNTGERSVPAGWRAKITLRSGVDLRITLSDTSVLPAFPAGTVVPIGPFAARVPHTLHGHDRWWLEIAVVDPRGNETLLFRSQQIDATGA
ncbi:MAG TPA: hypothetical protein VNL77_12880 [Roseiflexaceae bacterium]|nr:hypothetical protein [Roseiflexaceae bacterium]